MGESDRDTLRVHFDARVRLEFHGATIRGGVSQRIRLLVHELARQRRIHRGGLQRSVSRGLLYRGCDGKTWRWEWGPSRALLRRQRLPPARLLGVYCPYKEVPHYPLTLSPVYFMKIQPDQGRGHSNGFGRIRILWDRLRFYIPYTWRFLVLRHPEPLIYGIALTDRCNLACKGCHVSNTGRPDMTWERLVDSLQNAWHRGFRELYFSGGEPMLWRDGEHTLEDAIVAAKRMGFFHVHVYTNGTLGLRTSADLVWVSMDGLPATFERRRGKAFAQVEGAVRQGRHPKVAVIYVIDRNTADGIEPFLRWVHATAFPVMGVMFYFHTPYYGRDELFLTAEERVPIIGRLLDCIKAGLPVINSRAGLLALKSGDWPRRLPVAYVMDIDGEYVCCRASDEICADCGYAACTELTEFQRLRPSALLGMLRYW